MYIRCPYYRQTTNYSCWPTSVKMLLDFWENDQEYSEKALIKYLKSKPNFWSDNQEIINFFVNFWYRIYFSTNWNDELIEKFLNLWLPIFINYKNLIFWWWHYSVIVWSKKTHFILNDPSYWDWYKINKKTFLDNWTNWKWDIKNWFLVPIKEQYFHFYDLEDLKNGFIWIW